MTRQVDELVCWLMGSLYDPIYQRDDNAPIVRQVGRDDKQRAMSQPDALLTYATNHTILSLSQRT